MDPVTVDPQPGAAVSHRPLGYRARAWWGDDLVAASDAAVRVEEPGRAPALYFPAPDVRLALLRDEGRRARCPVKGEARLWSLDGDRAAAGTGTWAGEAPARTGGADAAWSFDRPAPGCEWLANHVAFDHDRVRVEVVDAGPGDGERDVTVKRFPTWGDAADLVDLLDVRAIGGGVYESATRDDHRRPVVEASQILGQAIVAASREVPGRRVVSAHLVAMRAADARLPLRFAVERLTSGRTFTTLLVEARQGDRRCATATLLLDVTAPDVIRHAAPAPPAAGPYESVPYDMGVTGRDLRVAGASYTDDPDAPVGPPIIDAWVRFREVPADPPLHAGLVAQFTGHMSIAAALRPHAGIGQQAAHRTLSTAVNAIALSLHTEARADRWLRYHHHSTFAGDGMTHSECRVYDEAGALAASFAVDAMVRAMPGGAPADARTAL